MYENSLTVDIPLGPLEGTPVTVHSAKGRNAKLHTTTDCSQLRTAAVTEATVALDAATVGRLCAECWSWGPWTRSGSGLGVFLRALGGGGLLSQLHCYDGPDEDVHWDDGEVQIAARLLHSATADQEDDEEDDAPDGGFVATPSGCGTASSTGGAPPPRACTGPRTSRRCSPGSRSGRSRS